MIRLGQAPVRVPGSGQALKLLSWNSILQLLLGPEPPVVPPNCTDVSFPIIVSHSAGTLDAHSSGKLTGAKLDNAMAGVAAEYAAARGKSRALSAEQESSLKAKAAAAQVPPIITTS